MCLGFDVSGVVNGTLIIPGEYKGDNPDAPNSSNNLANLSSSASQEPANCRVQKVPVLVNPVIIVVLAVINFTGIHSWGL